MEADPCLAAPGLPGPECCMVACHRPLYCIFVDFKSGLFSVFAFGQSIPVSLQLRVLFTA